MLVDLRPDKCVIVGGPNSSGTCWLTKLIGDYLDVPIFVDERHFSGYGVVKSELLPKNLPKSLKIVTCFYIYRDIRDAFISRYFKATYRETLQRFILGKRRHMMKFLKNWHLYGGLHGYREPLDYYNDAINAWLDTDYAGVRYEDLRANTAGELKRLIQSAYWPVDENKICAVVEANRFEVLKKAGGMGWSSKSGNRCFKDHPKYFRSGKVNEWKRVLPKDILDIIVKKCGNTLIRAGYEV